VDLVVELGANLPHSLRNGRGIREVELLELQLDAPVDEEPTIRGRRPPPARDEGEAARQGAEPPYMHSGDG
jgi:hypothetical protein